jgi:hypothetical protein
VGPISQRVRERGRLVVVGTRTDDGDKCSLLVVSELGGQWCLYPHGAAQLGVRMPTAEAERVARFLLGGAR